MVVPTCCPCSIGKANSWIDSFQHAWSPLLLARRSQSFEAHSAWSRESAHKAAVPTHAGWPPKATHTQRERETYFGALRQTLVLDVKSDLQDRTVQCFTQGSAAGIRFAFEFVGGRLWIDYEVAVGKSSIRQAMSKTIAGLYVESLEATVVEQLTLLIVDGSNRVLTVCHELNAVIMAVLRDSVRQTTRGVI